MSFDVDGATEGVADALRDAGFVACVQPVRSAGHVAWRGRFVNDGPLEGVRWIVVQSPEGDWPVVGRIRIDDSETPSGFHDLGFGIDHPRVGTMRWRVAEGYVNGYPLLDILWYALTRFRRNRSGLRNRR